MSEQDTTNEPAEGQEQDTTTETPDLGDAGKKAIKAERDARKALEQQLAAVQSQLREREQAELTDLERAQAQAQEAMGELERLRLESTRSKVALTKGVPADLLDFLTGSSEEEIAAKADTLLARLNTSTTPRPDPSQGAKGEPVKGTTADIFGAFMTERLS